MNLVIFLVTNLIVFPHRAITISDSDMLSFYFLFLLIKYPSGHKGSVRFPILIFRVPCVQQVYKLLPKSLHHPLSKKSL